MGQGRRTSMRSRRATSHSGRRAIVNPATSRSRPAARNVHAMPPRADEHPAAVSDSPLRASAVLVYARKAAQRLLHLFRSCAWKRPRRQVRDRERRVPFAQVGLLSAQRDDVRDVPRPARHPARCQGRRALRGRLPELPQDGAYPRSAAGAGVGAGATCLDCHMPKRRTEDAVHVVDDRPLHPARRGRSAICWRRQGSGQFRARRLSRRSRPRTTRRRCRPRRRTICIWPWRRCSRARTSRRASARLEQAIEKHKPERADFYYELARAYSKTSNDDAAIRWAQDALRRDASFAPALKELAAAATDEGPAREAAQALEKVGGACGPRTVTPLADLGNIYLQQDRVETRRRALGRRWLWIPTIRVATTRWVWPR